MSPEQIRGDHVDGRADLWALGVVLYEMLGGRKPFGRDEEVASALAILHDVPILLTTQRVEISSALEGLVLRLLQKDPAKRYTDAGEFLLNLDRVGMHVDGAVGHLQTRWRRVRRTLTGTLRPATRRVLFGAGTVATLALAYPVILLVRAQPASTSDAMDSSRSIAVLPFDNVGGDSTNLPFSDGFADELTTALGKVSRLSVMARTSAFTLKKRGLDAREIGRQLHVQFIVAGSVRRVANRRRVTASLLDVKSGKEVWSEDFVNNALNRDVFAVQDSITRSIVRQLLPRISPAVVASSANRSTENSEAHDLYLQGRYFFEKRDSAGLRKAREYFERAIRADSSYALAYSGLADAYAMQATFGFAFPNMNFPKAKAYAALALADDSTLVEVHTSLAFIAVFYDWDYPTATVEFDKALTLSDRNAPTHLYHAWYYLLTDSVSQAINAMHRALDLDPYSGLINTRLISILFYAGHYNEALTQARQVFERDSNFVGVRQELARAYVVLGRCSEALAALHNSVEQPLSLLQGVRGYTYAKCGRRLQARAELNHLVRRARSGEYISHYALALIQAGLGDNEEAIGELEKASAERPGGMFMIKREPAFAGLHSDPRFVALLRKVNLAA
jgi:serine/threonine-protein kinase